MVLIDFELPFGFLSLLYLSFGVQNPPYLLISCIKESKVKERPIKLCKRKEERYLSSCFIFKSFLITYSPSFWVPTLEYNDQRMRTHHQEKGKENLKFFQGGKLWGMKELKDTRKEAWGKDQKDKRERYQKKQLCYQLLSLNSYSWKAKQSEEECCFLILMCWKIDHESTSWKHII